TFKTDASGASKVVAGPGIILLALVASAPGCRPSTSSSPAPPPSAAAGRTALPRGVAPEAPAVVFLGDSLTAGYGLDPAQAYPAQQRPGRPGVPPHHGSRLRPPLPWDLSAAREEERCRADSVPARRRGGRAVPEPGRRDPSDGRGPTEAGGNGVEGAAAAADR